MIYALIYFVVAVILFSVAYYVVNSMIPDGQAKKIATILLVVVGAIVVCYMLLNFAGGSGHLPSMR
jgi:hypothetical protein